MKSILFRKPAALMLTGFRMVSSLTTSINLKDPTLLRAPSVTFHRESLQVFDPAASEKEINDGSAVIALVEAMDRKDAKKSIQKASDAFAKFRFQTTALDRSAMLTKWSNLISDNADDLAKIMTLESGKPLRESIGEVKYGTSFIDFYAGEAIRSTSTGGGTILPSPFASVDGSPRGKVMAIQQPVGVVAMITPWNFPLAMITRKVAPALAAGCTVVLKPSELTPLTAIAIKHLAMQAGIPDDVFQLVIADTETTPDVGEEFCKNKIVKKISFTGSTAVGKLLMKMSSDDVKRLSLELGGNAPFIIFDDADMDQAVNAAISSKFRNSGQTCVCADRFLIHEDIEQEFIHRLCEKVKEFKIGHGLKEETTMGPLIQAKAAVEVKRKVDEAIEEGAECVIGGDMALDLGPNFFQPTILRNVDQSSSIWKTETFGPVVAISTFRNEEDAVNRANDSPLGLASYFCTKDLARILRVSEQLENGLVGVNEGVISTASAPFGGVKESGLGREGSTIGIAEYTETKYIYLNP
ncbi:aldehyde dehydrogenase [Chaetoceros tenuissimus]|uniref:Succinate-semialdehyde dehydrogenase, mitochondrial n=1 Tax=Chaetoceros tenuissimus TaxID=426638 RepID=A0AAD3D8M1_9STRA|nr:aldehyde dehydrogenase [Chaetoceros tenuissimus]